MRGGGKVTMSKQKKSYAAKIRQILRKEKNSHQPFTGRHFGGA